jgi:Reverse transcriptase (RNA-dependent DNA polymerase)
MVVLYVDDLLIAGSTKNMVTQLESIFEAKYNMKKLNAIEQLLGMEIFYNKLRNTIHITQKQYIEYIVESFRKYGISKYRTPMDERQHYFKSQVPKEGSPEALLIETLPFRELIGSLLWVLNGTRPDVTYSVNTLTHVYKQSRSHSLESCASSSVISEQHLILLYTIYSANSFGQHKPE